MIGDEPVLLHTCEDGHTWREQPDGGVSPSWGLAGTSVHFDQPANRCPEPESHIVQNGIFEDDRGVECPSCGRKALPWDLYEGISCSPWDVRREAEESGHTHESPTPVCSKPPVRTRRWQRVGKGKRAPLRWVDVEAGAGLEYAEAGEQGVLC